MKKTSISIDMEAEKLRALLGEAYDFDEKV